jgi:hypothetical protein
VSVEAKPCRRAITALGFALLFHSCSTEPDPPYADFVVQVGAESFLARIADPAEIVRFREAMAGIRSGFPLGLLRSGDGGFNSPWSWHLDPEETSLVEVAIEVCDGSPSYVETHQSEFPTYCPWGARIVAER